MIKYCAKFEINNYFIYYLDKILEINDIFNNNLLIDLV